MFVIIAALLAIAWALGFTVMKVSSGAIHILLVLALASAIVHLVRGGSKTGSGPTSETDVGRDSGGCAVPCSGNDIEARRAVERGGQARLVTDTGLALVGRGADRGIRRGTRPTAVATMRDIVVLLIALLISAAHRLAVEGGVGRVTAVEG